MGQLAEIAALLEMNEHELSPETSLASLEAWSSITVIGFMAMADETYGLSVAPSRLRDAKTIRDLLVLLTSAQTVS